MLSCAGGATWPSQEGQDFIADHASPSIDFATIHSWIDNWQVRCEAAKPHCVAFGDVHRA